MFTSVCHLFFRLKELEDGGIAALMDFIQGLEALMIDPQFPIPLVHKSSVTGVYASMHAFDNFISMNN